MTEEIITDYRQTVQRLQEELKEKSDMIFKLMDYVARLEQENRELKETVKDLNQSIQNCNIQRTKMYKALEEIREIVMESKPVDEPISQTEFTVRRMDLQTNKLIRVLAKINEVLGNEKM